MFTTAFVYPAHTMLKKAKSVRATSYTDDSPNRWIKGM